MRTDNRFQGMAAIRSNLIRASLHRLLQPLTVVAADRPKTVLRSGVRKMNQQQTQTISKPGPKPNAQTPVKVNFHFLLVITCGLLPGLSSAAQPEAPFAERFVQPPAESRIIKIIHMIPFQDQNAK